MTDYVKLSITPVRAQDRRLLILPLSPEEGLDQLSSKGGSSIKSPHRNPAFRAKSVDEHYYDSTAALPSCFAAAVITRRRRYRES